MKIKLTKEAKIGIFMVACLFAMFWGINFLKGKNVFSSNNTYYVVFTSVDGLKPTNDVLINGFKVGLIEEIEFNDIKSGKFKVNLLISKKYKLPRNTIAKLISADLMGGKAIKLEISSDTAYYQPGDTLPGDIEVGLIDQLGHQMTPVKEKAEQLMVQLNNTLLVVEKVFNEENRDQLSQGIANLNASLNNISQISAALDTMLNSPKGSLKTTFSNIESVSSNLKKSNKELTNIIQNVSSVSDSLADINLAQTFTKLETTLNDIQAIIAKVNSGEGTLGNLVSNDSLYTNLQKVTLSLDLLINDIKNNPKRYVSFSLIDLNRSQSSGEKVKE
jgi:phospholipid/cholesterol/gamma-HCH transport system substrate-binding protein